MKLMGSRTIRTIAATVGVLAAGSAFACMDNSYYPLVAGATWTYQADGMTYSQSVLEVTADSVRVSVQFDSEEAMEMTYQCGEDGVLVSSVLDGLVEGMDFEILSQEGTSYPNVINVGDEWEEEIVMASTMTMEGMEMTTRTTVATLTRATALESVTVPAGTFNALRLEGTSDITNVTVMMGMEIPVSMTSTTQTWLVEGIGMVLSVDESGGRVELVSYTIP